MATELSLEDFIDHLERDFSWRGIELTSLILLHGSREDLIIPKSIILLLYSHWEGYIKNACKQYLVHVSGKGISVERLTKNFLAISLKGYAKKTLESSSSLNLVNEINLVNGIHDSQNNNFSIPQTIVNERHKAFIDTRDNLNLKILNSFCSIVGIGKVNMIEGRENYIDKELLAQRNAIGHGNKVHPDSAEFSLHIDEITTLRDVIFMLMTYVQDELIYFAENELYLAENQEQVAARKELRSREIRREMERILTNRDS